MVTYSFSVVCLLMVLSAYVHADTWSRGALALHAVSGEVALSELGEDLVSFGSGQVPHSVPSLINCRAAYGSSALFSTSNRSFVFFEGKGSFAIERFEQITPEESMWASNDVEPTRSRMIINFRAGKLIVDNRQMRDASQCLIETPLGRVSVKKALWQMRIVFEPQSKAFNFTIACSEGRVRFTDLRGQHYTLRAGQRLSGVGEARAPSIEVGETTDANREDMQRFVNLESAHLEAAQEFALYQSHLQPIKQAAASPSGVEPAARNSLEKRPIVIEYASEPDMVTPFRGEVEPPRKY